MVSSLNVYSNSPNQMHRDWIIYWRSVVPFEKQWHSHLMAERNTYQNGIPKKCFKNYRQGLWTRDLTRQPATRQPTTRPADATRDQTRNPPGRGQPVTRLSTLFSFGFNFGVTYSAWGRRDGVAQRVNWNKYISTHFLTHFHGIRLTRHVSSLSSKYSCYIRGYGYWNMSSLTCIY